MDIITGRELIAARAIAGFNQKQFAGKAGISSDTLNRLEQSGTDPIRATRATVDKIKTCLAQHSIALAPGCIIHQLGRENPGAVNGRTPARAETAVAARTSGAGVVSYLR